MTKEATKKKILEAGSRIIHEKGYNNTGIQEILNDSGVPKGSFYFYFKSKEDFGLALIDEFESVICGRLADAIKDRSMPPLERLKFFFSSFRQFFEEYNCSRGCPIGNLSQELSDINENIRQRLEGVFDTMNTLTMKCLYEARINGQLDSELPVAELAEYIISSWEGAILRMKVSRSIEPLLSFERILFGTILK